MLDISRTKSGWRAKPGFLTTGGSEFESIHILLGRFLADRTSPSPLTDLSVVSQNQTFQWGQGCPLEKVVDSSAVFHELMIHPQIFRNAISIIEPWEHVGYNTLGEHVRASENTAYLLQKIADCDSVLFPLWQSGLLPMDQFLSVISSGLAIIFQGGEPSARDSSTFVGSRCSHEELLQLAQGILLSRTPTSAPALFICLGHQLAAQAHIRLLHNAVESVLGIDAIVGDTNGKALRALQRVCQKIQNVGDQLAVTKKNGQTVAESWNDFEFAVAKNESKEVGIRQLLPYACPDYEVSDIPESLIMAHEVTANEHEGVIDTSIQYKREVNISMFHSDEVNEEAILFSNWAYRLLHDALIPIRHIIANSSLSWLIRLPDAIEILCSTEENDQPLTECSATCIYYRDFETNKVRRSFTCQFHPELLADLRSVGSRKPPTYSELKEDDGARLFMRLLYAGMQE